jgi:dTDP-4-amino-4,6-dideoxygalactose transaminase
MSPIFLDAQAEHFGLDLDDLKRKADDLDCLVLVHTFGYPSDFDRIAQIMEGRPIVEDCAHSLGSAYRGRPLGVLSDISFFSFGFFKPTATGGGGCIVTKNTALKERLTSLLAAAPAEPALQEILHVAHCLLYSFAFKPPAFTIAKYFRYRAFRAPEDEEKLSTQCENILSSQLGMRRSDGYRVATRLWAHRESNDLAEFWKRVRRYMPATWHVPAEPLEGKWNHFMLPIRTPTSEACTDAICSLRRHGVDAARIYPNCVFETSPAGYSGGCLKAECLADRVLALPCHNRLSPAEQNRILRALEEIGATYAT